MEIWKDIPGYPGYQASNLGEIRNVTSMKTLSQFNNQRNCLSSILVKDGKRVARHVHYIIADTFLEKTGEFIHHKNNNQKDNRPSNLEWGYKRRVVTSSDKCLKELLNSGFSLTPILRDRMNKRLAGMTYKEIGALEGKSHNAAFRSIKSSIDMYNRYKSNIAKSTNPIKKYG